VTQKFVVYGLGISGLSAATHLAEQGFEVIATDDNEQAIITSAAKKIPGVVFKKPDEISYDKNTTISFSPGIPLFAPQPHKILEIVKKSGATLACDIEIFYRQNSQNNFIGITGTNGKSTTTALTGFVLQELGLDARVGGNIGVACFELIKKDESSRDKTFVFETSSYQLDLLSQTHFHIAALLNITPDHLDRHGSMAGYIAAKKRIFRNQTEQDFALIDVDNENSHAVFLELKNDKNFRAKLIPISTVKPRKGGISLIDGVLTNDIFAYETTELKSEFLRGKHNEQNIAFAFAMAQCLTKKPAAAIISAIQKFKGLRHRMQLLGEIDGVKFVNDSKATNAESTEHALKAYENIFLILGGKAKDGGISSLQPLFKKISKAYLIGEASDNFAKILQKNSVDFEKCGNLKNAFTSAFRDAKKSAFSTKVVMLSPACASFDQWKNFEQRGDYFCELFENLAKT
jgi:UDP-N-acetylmuramoylalanine--D-glutamate ligase